jgi:DNA-binding transcriptional MerR regulator
MEEPHWTLDELADRVETALAVDYQGQASGRVRAVPDRRAIRWYTTIGLVDRPTAHRGRTALYGPRHLLQLVAVKRLQARGLPLVSIQEELAGATDAQLARVARLPAGGTAGPVPRPSAAGRSAATAPGPAGGRTRRARFWREQPAAALLAGPADPTVPDGPTDPAREEATTPRAATMRGVRLGDGATLLLEPGRELGPGDVQAILDAARPLLVALRDRGLHAGARNPDQEPEARRAEGNGPRREHP